MMKYEREMKGYKNSKYETKPKTVMIISKNSFLYAGISQEHVCLRNWTITFPNDLWLFNFQIKIFSNDFWENLSLNIHVYVRVCMYACVSAGAQFYTYTSKHSHAKSNTYTNIYNSKLQRTKEEDRWGNNEHLYQFGAQVEWKSLPRFEPTHIYEFVCGVTLCKETRHGIRIFDLSQTQQATPNCSSIRIIEVLTRLLSSCRNCHTK